jgi:hypothetical protein
MAEWEYDKYFAPVEGVFIQEHIIYKRLERGVKRIKITRQYFADGDYQDSVITDII